MGSICSSSSPTSAISPPKVGASAAAVAEPPIKDHAATDEPKQQQQMNNNHTTTEHNKQPAAEGGEEIGENNAAAAPTTKLPEAKVEEEVDGEEKAVFDPPPPSSPHGPPPDDPTAHDHDPEPTPTAAPAPGVLQHQVEKKKEEREAATSEQSRGEGGRDNSEEHDPKQQQFSSERRVSRLRRRNTLPMETAVSVSLRIDGELMLERKQLKRVVKLLLLGPSESGKSTVLKQFRIIHLNGYAPAELRARRPLVHRNVVQAMLQLLDAGRRFGIPLPTGERERDAAVVLSLADGGGCPADECEALDGLEEGLDDDVYLALKRLWCDESVQAIYARRSEFNLLDCAKYFLDELDRLHAADYMPTTADILAARVMTVGVTEIRFPFRQLEFRVFDVGGQRSQRRKWIHLFDNVNAVFFIAAMAEYDQHMREDPSKNRLHDALELFGEVGNNPLFGLAHMILFLNKKDLFADKIERVPLTVCFPNYKYDNDYDSASRYIVAKFRQQIESSSKMVYSHMTCATDTEQVKFVTDSVNNMILSSVMKKSGW